MIRTLICAVTLGIIVGVIGACIETAPISFRLKTIAYIFTGVIVVPTTSLLVKYVLFTSVAYQGWAFLIMLLSSFVGNSLFKLILNK